MSVIEALEKALELIKAGWCQGIYKKPIWYALEEGEIPQYCSLGAIRAIIDPFAKDPTPYLQVQRALFSCLEKPSEPDSPWHSIVDFNDTEGRTQGEVIALFERAIEKERAKVA